MDQPHRRDFLGLSAAALAESAIAQQTGPAGRRIRLGFVGIGQRAVYHLDCALGMEGVEVPALCEIIDERLQRAARMVQESGRPAPRLYGRGETDFQRLCAEEDLDAVICATSWQWHAPVCLAANRNGKHAVSEVPIVLTVEEAWELVEAFEKTGKWSTLGLEQVLLEVNDGVYLTVLNMARQGVFGEILHIESGYLHDLRKWKLPGGTEPWRLEHSLKRNGNLYPDHPMNRIIPMMGINHGDRCEYLTSMSSRSLALHDFLVAELGRDHPLAKAKVTQGDYNATLLRTVSGQLVTLNWDTHTPHPRESYRVQGTKGVFYETRGPAEPQIYLDGLSPRPHQWEPAAPYLVKYRHPLLKSYKPDPRRKSLRGYGYSAETPITWHLLIRALREGKVPYFDVYDSVTSSVVSPLSEASVAKRSAPVDFPDFTRGRWKSRPPIEFA
jgi:predicted dehydrogenase